jgi:hypothetical protein
MACSVVRKNISAEEYTVRVSYGKKIEKSIQDELRKTFVIQDPTASEDMYDKVDGYIVSDNGTRTPLQIKYRETGEDVLFETAFLDRYENHALVPRDLSSLTLNGRDMIGKSAMYACLSKDGCSIWMCDTDTIKKRATAMATHLIQLFQSGSRTSYKDKDGEVRMTTDHATNRRKIMFFAKPSFFAFKTIRLGESLWKKNVSPPPVHIVSVVKPMSIVKPMSLSKQPSVNQTPSLLPATSVWGKK